VLGVKNLKVDEVEDGVYGEKSLTPFETFTIFPLMNN
jgi:hypothetical protein